MFETSCCQMPTQVHIDILVYADVSVKITRSWPVFDHS